MQREEHNRYAKYIPVHSAARQRTSKPSRMPALFCRYQSYCFPPRELVLLASGGLSFFFPFFVICDLFRGSFSRRVMNLLIKQLHKSNMRRKAGGKRETWLRWILHSAFKLWYRVAECWVNNPSLAFRQTKGLL